MRNAGKAPSHVGIVRAVAALRDRPVDVLGRVLDVAGLAVHAVLEVDHEARLALVLDELVDPGRAVALRRAGIARVIHRHRHILVLQTQVAGLAFLVVGERERHVGQAVEAQLAVGLGIVDRLVMARRFGRGRIGLAVAHGAEQREAELVGPHVETAHRKRRDHPPFRPHRLDVAHLPQILADGTIAHLGLVGAQLVGRAARLQRLMGRLGRRLAREHGVVVALDARHVDHAHRAAQQRHAGRNHLRHRLVAALRDRPRAVGHALTALEQRRHVRVMLEALELHVGEEVRVLVVQVHHEADIHLVVLDVVDEGTAAGIAAQRPAHGVLDPAFLVLGGVDLPDLLHPEAEFLRLLAVGEVVLGDHLLGERAAHALGEEHVLAVQFHPRLVARAGGAVWVLAELAGDHALHLAIVAIDQFRARHAREDLDAQRLGLLCHPAADIAHGNDVVAVVRHERRHRPVRNAHLAGLAEHVELVLDHRHVDRRALVLPVRDQRVETTGIDHRAGQDMGAHLRAFLEHNDLEIGIQLLQADRRGQACRPRPHDHHIVFHRLALDLGHADPSAGCI
ncbi:hypothetical protein R2601_13804 [Salipiger bermudensis HTCC2601]|uniref:Uncharacterized protein n=1 Tax=Salipiger bermudensis (strain DSM 26914 / JCM 13377 / KCTC 12554 / HTCC2601) TaxID=314265 RepID=Q0FRF3_SALBH|nr:hypothetical protein R2601_13804 [Salipiger bermudensis HTCC2601]